MLQVHAAIPDIIGGVALSDADFNTIAHLARDWYGLSLPASKKQLVYGRLIRRLRALGIADFRTYLKMICENYESPERQQFLGALTTNVTQFFREAHHFRMLEERILPPLIEAARRGARVRIWSAGCSSGQEPYSIALTILKLCAQANRFDLKILATDIDPGIMTIARAANYQSEELIAIPADMNKEPQWITNSNNGRFTIGDEARSLVTFAELNLIRDWPMRGKFDVIFCRNVAIYFDQTTQSDLWMRFCEKLTETGHLIIGHSEHLSGPSVNRLKSFDTTTYVKNAAVCRKGESARTVGLQKESSHEP